MALETIQSLIDRRHYEWVRDEPTEDDLNHILKETAPSPFDLILRKEVYDDLKAGRAHLVTKRSTTAKVLAIVYPDTEIPWDTFGKIFQAYGPSKNGLWRLVWFANKRPRMIPKGQPKACHMNGGYTYACQSDIVIYREEEVERVLVHELLHASCTDDMNQPEEIREVITESWAEIFLIAILANTPAQAKKLWAIQAQWIVDQEVVLKRFVKGPANYAWRYTLGRRGVLEELGFKFPAASQNPAFMLGGSLRFTSPELSPR